MNTNCEKCGSDNISVRYLAPYMCEYGFAGLFGGFVGVEPDGTLVIKCRRCGFEYATAASRGSRPNA